jgi:hypothetical protein
MGMEKEPCGSGDGILFLMFIQLPLLKSWGLDQLNQLIRPGLEAIEEVVSIRIQLVINLSHLRNRFLEEDIPSSPVNLIEG